MEKRKLKMPKWFSLTILMLVILGFGTGTVSASDRDITLKVDNAVVATDVSPVIENGRTLVPYRALLEALGGEVSWDPKKMTATAVLGSDEVKVTIDSTIGYVNGVQKTLDVPARIIDGRTLIPVRFVLENLKCTVLWDNDTRTVLITSPKNSEATKISSVKVEKTDTAWRVAVTGDNLISGMSTTSYFNPDRFGVDIKNAVLTTETESITTDSELFSAVRFSQYSDTTVRIVVDLNEKIAGNVSLSADHKTLYIDFAIQKSILPLLNPAASQKLVAIDPGHGGNDPGSSGVYNGRTINEKDINLSVAKRLYALLSAASVNVKLLRDSDSTISIYNRPAEANRLGASLYIAVHNNCYTSAVPHGSEILYYNKAGETDKYGFTSQQLATFLQKDLIESTGLPSRGIKNNKAYIVLNRTTMPAVIVEGGFLSNPSDLEYMVTGTFVEDYAQAAAKGIIQTLNLSVE